MIEQPSAGDRKIEDLETLRADSAGELAIAADGVFACDTALLMRDRAKRNVRLLVEEAVICLDAIIV